jgi:hypothetical protein
VGLDDRLNGAYDQIMTFEPYLQERIDAAKEKARKIVAGEVESEKELVEAMVLVLSRHYGLPFFDSYFEDRTFDDLIFEVELLKLSRQSNSEQGSGMLAAASKEEKESLVDDWVEADMASVNKQAEEDAKRFMETGNFK